MIDSLNLFDLLNENKLPTRITDHSSTLLDPIKISASIYMSSAFFFSNIEKKLHPQLVIHLPHFWMSNVLVLKKRWVYYRVESLKFARKLDVEDWNTINMYTLISEKKNVKVYPYLTNNCLSKKKYNKGLKPISKVLYMQNSRTRKCIWNQWKCWSNKIKIQKTYTHFKIL